MSECTNKKLEIFSFEHYSYINQIFGDITIRRIIREVYRDLAKKFLFKKINTGEEFENSFHHVLKDKETAAGKTKDEANMLLNHKEALDFIISHPDYINPLTISSIEDIHSILAKDLDINRNIRKSRVGISGTNYKPLDNEFQIKEALEEMCKLINSKENVFEKALLALVLISYIQPFADGNKRTARIISNAILMNHHFCPISFRTIDSLEYKKAMLIFYEQTNINPFKKIFINQFEFAVNTYF